MHLPAVALPGASTLQLDPAGQYISGRIFARGSDAAVLPDSFGRFTTLSVAAGLTLTGTKSALLLNGSAGTVGQVPLSQGPGNTPVWGTAGGSSVPDWFSYSFFGGL